MKKLLCFLAALGALLLAGCGKGRGESFLYDGPEHYTPGGASLTQPVKRLEIDWLAGSVRLENGGGDELTFEETANRPLSEELSLHWWLEGETLHLKFCASGRWTLGGLQKDLTVTLPQGLTLEEVEITTVSAGISAPELSARSIDWSTTSGDMTAQFFDTAELHLDTVSGVTNVTSDTDVRKVKIGSTSGDISLALGVVEELDVSTVSGRVQAEALQCGSADLESTSGDITLQLRDLAGPCDIDTVSGRVKLSLPEGAAFDLDFDTVSGKLDSELTGTPGGVPIEVDTTSGNLTLRRLS